MIEKEAVHSQTRLVLTVKDPAIIGLTDHHQKTEKPLRNLILALNLHLKNNCLNLTEDGLFESEIIRPSGSNVKVTQGPQGPIINVTCEISESVHFTLGSKERIDENMVITTYNSITRFDRFGFKSTTTREVNISKALNEFEHAMQPINRIRVFRSLFNCLEFCVNSTGAEKKGDGLDSEISKITRVSKDTVGCWRDLYNRTKHADLDCKQTAEYKKGIENLTDILPEIRSAAQTLLSKNI